MPDIDSLLDSTLDDLEDLPTFEPYPAGAHKVLATFDTKDIDGHGTCAELSFKYVECIELANPQDEAPQPGDQSSCLFMFDNEFGRGNFKKCAEPFGAALGTMVNREIIEQTNDIECLILTSIRKDKSDPDRLYLNVKEIGIE